jgi:hypothetical protein
MTLRAKPVASAEGLLGGQDPRFLNDELFLSQQAPGFHLAKFLLTIGGADSPRITPAG